MKQKVGKEKTGDIKNHKTLDSESLTDDAKKERGALLE